ncbi:MAG: thiamine phosphate synthase [Alphaproteobacteria bacterium]|nr:MAG: thiamine phosphate synthase [Alphaproteobacteria bacterium]
MSSASEPERIRTRLYLISPPVIDLDAFAAQFEEALAGGDVACFQLRLKDRPEAEVRAATLRLKPIAEAADVAFLLNDNVKLARELNTDGVHVGQEDMPYAEARSLLGADKIIGVTCKNSRHLAMEAADAGADYVAFGAFFPSSTKDATVKAETDLLEWWSSFVEVPTVAIGGITVENCAELVKAGADFLAVAAGVWQHPEGPKAAVAAFNRVIDQAMAT